MPSHVANCALPLSRLLKRSDILPLHYARCFCLHCPGHRRRRRTPQRTQAFCAIRLPLSGRYNRGTLWIRVIPLTKFLNRVARRCAEQSVDTAGRWLAEHAAGKVRMTWHGGAFVQPSLHWKSNVYYISCVCVCVCSLTYPACNAHAPYCHLWTAAHCSIFPHYLIKKRFLKKKITIHKMCVLFFCTRFVWNIPISKKK